MQSHQVSKTNYKVSDFISWAKASTLILSPSFQRRSVWPAGAKSYLIDTIVRGLPIADGSCRGLYCSHVLEHVDDVAALAELFRVLKPDGVALLAVPIVEGWETSYEDPSIIDDYDRLVHFGQEDHVRRYGRDFRDRVRQAGFVLTEFAVNGHDSVEYSIIPGERVFIARRPHQAGKPI